MDTTGCPRFFATDTAFRSNVPGACDTSLIGFYVLGLVGVFLSFVASVKQTKNWLERPKHTSWFPRGPVNSFIFSFCQLLSVILIGQNVISYYNGFSFMLASILFLNFAYSYSLGVIRLVSLGERIIPKSKAESTQSHASLGKFDGLGKLLFIFQTAFLFASSFALIILSPTMTQNEEVISRFGWGAKAVFIMLCQCGYWYQFERCIRVVRLIQKSDLDADAAGKTARMEQLDMAVVRMRQNQATHVLASPAFFVFGLIAVGAIVGSIWSIYGVTVAQAIAALYFEFATKPKKKPNGRDEKRNVGGIAVDDQQRELEISPIVSSDPSGKANSKS